MSTATLMIAVIGTGISLAGLMIGLIAWLRADIRRTEDRLRTDMRSMEDRLSEDINTLRKETGELRERMAHLEGLLEGLRESLMARAA